MKDFVNKNPTEPGTYWYKRPLWSDRPHNVRIIEKDGELYAEFISGYYFEPLKNIPADSLWSPAFVALSEFKEEVQKLLALLEDPQGLMSWRELLKEKSDNIAKLIDMPIDFAE